MSRQLTKRSTKENTINKQSLDIHTISSVNCPKIDWYTGMSKYEHSMSIQCIHITIFRMKYHLKQLFSQLNQV